MEMTDSYATERGRAVADAIKQGKIPLDDAHIWLQRLKEDPRKAAYLAAMAPGWRPANVNPVRQALNTGTPPPPPPVDRPTREVSLGNGLVNMQAQLIGGKPYSEWTHQECLDAVTWALGPRFRQGLKPPPEPNWFIPGDSVQHTTDAEWK
jgi:hypothetical protein